MRVERLPGNQEIKISAYNRTDASLVTYGCSRIWYQVQRHTNGQWEKDTDQIDQIACSGGQVYRTFSPDLRDTRTYTLRYLLPGAQTSESNPHPGTYRAFMLTGRDTRQLDNQPDTTFSAPFTVSAP